MNQEDFDEMPKLMRLPQDKPVKHVQLEQSIEPFNVNRSERKVSKALDNVLTRSPGVSESATPSSKTANRRPIISDADLRKTEKGLKIERTQQLQQMNEADKPTSPQKNTDRSKTLISQMVSKITAKNIAEELLPISNETINKLINQIEIEKAELVDKAMGYRLQLNTNPHNKNLQKEL